MKQAPGPRKAIFLDRDGTINKEVNYLSDPGQFELLPGAAETIAYWNAHDWLVILVTNQAGIGRGYFPSSVVDEVHRRMNRSLSEYGARLDAIFVCPHHPDEQCDCRKPKTLLFEQAVKQFNIALPESYLIGDKLTDILPARELGAKAILVQTGYGQEQLKELRKVNGFEVAIAADLADARRVIEQDGRE